MLKKGFIMTRNNPFGTKVVYYIILQHFVVVITLLFIKLKLNITF